MANRPIFTQFFLQYGFEPTPPPTPEEEESEEEQDEDEDGFAGGSFFFQITHSSQNIYKARITGG